ncbi:hypothetical protein FHS41_004540 [Streptomyces violarus]|uniref:Uncharacterized protein n=1 Tax=Streptomyces violarus TaxID=67380 RepID=A0A7W5F319_9ACTN|nr:MULTISPECIES: hypothetical protein [Streptomyces]MBB3078033.1 hypothetical protein [Streptomyces violarus]WRT99804.1 hypothetical protein VJ737_19805 [Streptomyces sp. CGMCC 4.1772]
MREAPAYSAPAPNPWITRSTTSSAGAHAPAVSYVGSAPIRALARPTVTNVITSIRLRPSRSP